MLIKLINRQQYRLFLRFQSLPRYCGSMIFLMFQLKYNYLRGKINKYTALIILKVETKWQNTTNLEIKMNISPMTAIWLAKLKRFSSLLSFLPLFAPFNCLTIPMELTNHLLIQIPLCKLKIV